MPTVTPLRRRPGSPIAVVPAGPYDGTVDMTVTVTATVLDDYGWGDLRGWTCVDDGDGDVHGRVGGGVVC